MLGNNRSWIDKIFLPHIEKNIFDSDRYIRSLENGDFRNKFLLGIVDDKGGSWLLKNFQEEPNALFVGGMGSGKSVSARFTLATWLASNSDHSVMFIIDSAKSAQDYKPLFKYKQVIPVLGSQEGVHKVIELMFDESVERNALFKKLGVENIENYEAKTKTKLTRYVVVMEEFHDIPFKILNFDQQFKTQGSSANKFHTLMRVGRAQGIWFIACSQRSLASDVPKEMVGNFTQKQMFKVTKGEAQYVLGHDGASKLRSNQKGRCFTEYGEVQFPFLDKGDVANLLENYIQPLESESAYLTPKIISDYLEGISTEELYSNKKLADLVRNIENVDSNVVASMLLKALNFKVERIDSTLDDNNITHIISKNGKRTAVMMRPTKKITGKHINKLIKGIVAHKCSSGYLITAAEGFSSTIHKYAKTNFIELLDKEDVLNWAIKIDNTKDAKELDIEIDQFANDDKENGTFDQFKSDEDDDFEDDEDFNLEDISLAELMKKENLGKNDEVSNMIDEIYNAADVDNVINKTLEKFDLNPEKKGIPQNEIVDDKGIFDTMQLIDGAKKLKRPTLNITFKLLPENNPFLLYHSLKNEAGEVYRILFYVIVDGAIKHRYFIDRKVTNEFSFIEKKKLGVASVIEWNEEPLVLGEQDFIQTVKKYLENFDICENEIYTTCWEKDLDFFEEYVKPNSEKISEKYTILDKHFQEIFGVSQSRTELIRDLGLKVDKSNDVFEELELDYQIWSHIN